MTNAKDETGATLSIGDKIEFAPNPRYPTARLRGEILRFRKDRGGPAGWIDAAGEDGAERSVRPSRCRLIAKQVRK